MRFLQARAQTKVGQLYMALREERHRVFAPVTYGNAFDHIAHGFVLLWRPVEDYQV